jgi:hypothetical protein
MWEVVADPEAVEAEAAEVEAAEAEVVVEVDPQEVAVEADLPEDSHLPSQQRYKPRQLRQMETEAWLEKNQIFSTDREAKATSSCRSSNCT